jgi:hypothetical protein
VFTDRVAVGLTSGEGPSHMFVKLERGLLSDPDMRNTLWRVRNRSESAATMCR